MKDYRDKVLDLIKDLSNKDNARIIFTMKNLETNNHRTFQIAKSEFADGKLVVGLLAGPDNEYSYINFAFLNPETGLISVWKKCRDDSNYLKYGDLMTELFLGVLPEKLVINHSGKCFKCGRTLTTPESIESGIGPVCGS